MPTQETSTIWLGFFFCIWMRTVDGPPVSGCGALRKHRLTKQACFLQTAATRSGRFSCPRQRSHRSPGKIGNANTRNLNHLVGVFLLHLDENGGRSTCFRLRCPAKASPDEAGLLSADRCPCLPPRFICHRQRSGAQPSRTQKLSTSAPTILGGHRNPECPILRATLPLSPHGASLV